MNWLERKKGCFPSLLVLLLLQMAVGSRDCVCLRGQTATQLFVATKSCGLSIYFPKYFVTSLCHHERLWRMHPPDLYVDGETN